MTRQPLVARHAEELLGSAVAATAPVAGGDVCVATKLRLSDGTTALMKTLNNAPPQFCATTYGGDTDGFIARLPLLNKPAPTWAEFFGQRRVLPYLKLARDNGRITPDEAIHVESVVARLHDLVPEEPPARLHGDLWNGNVLWGTEQRVWVIDPAAHGGHRETDLAMLALFGLPHLPRVLDAYEEVSPLADEWPDRVGIHQLHPLLVHACLFGRGYGARAGATAARYL